MWHASGRSIAW